ncbi:hypothetical protein [Streptomyces sp. NPDC048410]|uniref:hypothetical protein n=1 Tax=Streptomyces sp. NPDC048410 TaxID=3365545 RepID=UPI00371ED035
MSALFEVNWLRMKFAGQWVVTTFCRRSLSAAGIDHLDISDLGLGQGGSQGQGYRQVSSAEDAYGLRAGGIDGVAGQGQCGLQELKTLSQRQKPVAGGPDADVVKAQFWL